MGLRSFSEVECPIVWAIGGFDPCSGAGLQADLKTGSFLGAFFCTIATAMTAQNSFSVDLVETVDGVILDRQIQILKQDLKPQAIKIGMLGSVDDIRRISQLVSEFDIPVICDPVMISSSGAVLVDEKICLELRQSLFDKVTVLTPNIPEAETIVGFKISSPEDIERAAQYILSFGVKAVVIKGGHSNGKFSQDYFSDGREKAWITSPRKEDFLARGTGCTFASALAAALAFGYSKLDSTVIAKGFVNQGLRVSKKLGKGMSFLGYQYWPGKPEDLPWITDEAKSDRDHFQFPDLKERSLGFYPIMDRTRWLERFIPLGIKSAQLRIKDLRGCELEREIEKAILLARGNECRLFINDYWEIALKFGAFGIHLGQGDLEGADLTQISKAKMHLGVSTHCYSEVARAHSISPSYIAVGPIFPTTLKAMSFPPQGIQGVRIWKKLLSSPIVAIGGITIKDATDLINAGADSIAVVSDVIQNQNPEGRVKEWLKLFLQFEKQSNIS